MCCHLSSQSVRDDVVVNGEVVATEVDRDEDDVVEEDGKCNK